VEHPRERDDDDGGQRGDDVVHRRVAFRLVVAVVNVGLDVVVGRVVVGLVHAALGVSALQDVADFRFHVLDHLAAVGVGSRAIDRGEGALIRAIFRRRRNAFVALDVGLGHDGEEDGRHGGDDHQLGDARHHFRREKNERDGGAKGELRWRK